MVSRVIGKQPRSNSDSLIELSVAQDLGTRPKID